MGIDVSKDQLDVCILPQQERMSLATDEEGLKTMARTLAGLGVTLAVLEATGGLERMVVAHLVAEGLPLAVVNPQRTRQFARAAGILAKTDAVDAWVLARFARDIRPERRPQRSVQEQAIKELVSRRNQLMRMLVAEKNRLGRAGDKHVTASINSSVRFLDKQIAQVQSRIGEEIDKDPQLKERDDLLRSVPGVGAKTSRMLLAALPEIGTLTHKEAASLAGLAPFARESGKFKGKRMIGGGRGSVRQALFMATLVSIQHNPDIRRFYRRLKGSGKSGMVAVVACMRKLLITVNAVAARGSKWAPKNA